MKPLLEGLFTKDGGRIKTWKRRWFMLTPLLLTYGPNSKDSWSKYISTSSIMEILPKEKCTCRWPKSTKFGFGIRTIARTYHLATENPIDSLLMQSTIALILVTNGTLNDEGKRKCLTLIEDCIQQSDVVSDHIQLMTQQHNLSGLCNCNTSDQDSNATRLRICQHLGIDNKSEEASEQQTSLLVDTMSAEHTVQDDNSKDDITSINDNKRNSSNISAFTDHESKDVALESEEKLTPPPDVSNDPEQDDDNESGNATENETATTITKGDETSPEQGDNELVKIEDAIGHGRAPDTLSPAEILAFQQAEEAIDQVWKTIDDQVKSTIPAEPWLDEEPIVKNVRVFVSSTFADMYSEREVLIRKVFPRLKAFCKNRFLNLISCDLRWGVPKESSPEVVFRTCLREIDNCYKENVNPFFINLLGERYGWVPSIDEVPDTIREDYNWIDNTSITHMEILHGAMRNQNPNAAFFLRSFSIVDQLPDEFRSRFVDEGPLSRLGLTRLKRELRKRFPGHVFDYTPNFKEIQDIQGSMKPILCDMEEFADAVYKFLTDVIEKQYPLSRSNNSISIESINKRIDEFILAEANTVVGRDEEVRQILEFCRKYHEEPVPSIRLFAGIDDGGEAILSLAAAKAKEEGMNVFFIKVLSQSETKDVLLNRFYHHFGGNSIYEVFENIKKLDVPVVLFFCDYSSMDLNPSMRDDVNDFFESGKSIANLHFIFLEVPGVSISGGIPFVTNCLDNMKSVEDYNIKLSPLSQDAAQSSVQMILGKYNKCLDDEQMKILVGNPGSQSLAWIRCACEELRTFGVFETLTTRICSLPNDIPTLVRQVVERVLQDDDTGKVYDLICFLVAASSYLQEEELRYFLGDYVVDSSGQSQYEPLPMAIWMMVIDWSIPFVIKRILRGNEIMLKSWDTISAITQVLCDHYRDKNENSQDIDNPKILEIIFKEYRLKLFEYFNRDESWTKFRDVSICAVQSIAMQSSSHAYRTLQMKGISSLFYQMAKTSERMCPQCANRISFGAAQREKCFTCKKRVPFFNSTLGGEVPKNPNAFLPVYRCRRHASQFAYMKNVTDTPLCRSRLSIRSAPVADNILSDLQETLVGSPVLLVLSKSRLTSGKARNILERMGCWRTLSVALRNLNIANYLVKFVRWEEAALQPISFTRRQLSSDEQTFQILQEYKLHKIEDQPSNETTMTREEAWKYFKDMSIIRRLETTAGELYRAKYIRGFCHLYSGQEAVCVGMMAGMRPHDSLITAYRCHGWAYMLGYSIKQVFAELFGNSAGASLGLGGSMHFYGEKFYGGNGIVGAQVPVGAGIALAHQHKKDDGVCFSLYGDGAANQGQVFEAYNMAKLWNLPCIFVCENNKYGMGTSAERAAASVQYYTRGDYIPGIW
eukprot:gene10519-2646_t